MNDELMDLPEQKTPEQRSGDGVAVRANEFRLPHQMASYFKRPDRITEPLYVATVVFNPIRYRSRWKLYQDFKLMVANSGAVLYVAEIAFGHREFSITEEGNP